MTETTNKKNAILKKINGNGLTTVAKQIKRYSSISPSFNQDEIYSETFNLHELQKLNKNNAIACLNCSTLMPKKEHGDHWNCNKCNLSYSQYGNGLQIYIDKPLIKYNESLYTIIKTFPNNTRTHYDHQSTVYEHVIDKKIPSKIVPNLFTVIQLFNCPCCHTKYECIDHGDTWICNPCNTEFLSYGNSLQFTDYEIYQLQQKISQF